MSKNILTLFIGSFACVTTLSAQPCAAVTATGSASNAFTNIENGTNPVAVDRDLNTIVYVHRNNASTFGGHSGQLRYALSTDGGVTWNNNLGVLNPLSVNGTNAARYPQAAIYNPSGNTVPTNAYLSYLAPTTGATWNGNVSGVRRLDGTGNTETYNQPAASQTLIPYALCKGAPGEEWAIDWIYTGTAYTGFRIYKGTWNGSNDFVWTTNASITPTFNTAYSGAAQVADASIAFDPTGQYGWICLLTHITPGPTPYSFYPVFYRTTDGGNTWSSAMQVDIGTFPCITSNILAGNFASCGFDGDLVVDANGEPHFFTSVCNGNNAYAVYFGQWHAMVDITYHLGMFNARLVSNSNCGRGTWGVAPNQVTLDQQPIASRTADGTKIFFSWSDNAAYTLGQANLTPNLFGRAFDVVNRMWTNTVDFTACNGAIAGTIIHPKIACEVLEPAAGTYQLAGVYNIMTANDPINVCNFNFLSNLTWTNADFILAEPTATITINEGSSWVLCPSAPLTLTLTGSYQQVLWSDGSTALNSNAITAPGVYTVVARAGCNLGTDTIVVTALTATLTASDSALCTGDSTWLMASGNSSSYVWNPGNVTNDSLQDAPAASTTYSVTLTGSGGCTETQTITVNVNALPLVDATSAAAAVCIGDTTTINATGAAGYVWQPGNMTNATEPVAPTVATTYLLTGTDSNGCVNIDSVAVGVNALPVVATSVTGSPAICAGDTTTLTASGALSYAWTPAASLGNSSADTTTAFPTASEMYYVTGTDSNGCSAMDSVFITVYNLPVVAATSNSPVCAGQMALLHATGAGTYLWMPINVASDSASDTPSASTTYEVWGTDSNGCMDSAQVQFVVHPAPEVNINGDTIICESLGVTLTATGGVSYTWYPTNTTTNPLSDNPSASTTYTVVGTNANGCSDTAMHYVAVNPLPVVTFSLPVNQVCVDDGPMTLTSFAAPAGGTFSGNGVSGNQFDPGVAGTGTHGLSYTYTDTNGCANFANVSINVNACVGIAENGILISAVYPNPVTTLLTIETTSADAHVVEVTSIFGSAVYTDTFTGNRTTLDTQGWAAGVYLVKIRTGETMEVVRVVKG